MKRRAAVPSTESRHPHSRDIDMQSTREIVRRMAIEDAHAARAVAKASSQIAVVAEAVRDAIAAGGRLIYVGAGTSGRLGALDAAECPPTFGVSPRSVLALMAGGPRAMTRAIEGAEDDAPAGANAVRDVRVGNNDLVCGISASANASFVHAALAEAKKRGAKTALVTCTDRNLKAARSHIDHLIQVSTGAEVIAGSTRLKAGTATKLILNAISTAAMIHLGHVFHGHMIDVQPTNQKLRARSVRMISEVCDIDAKTAATLFHASGERPKLAIAMCLSGKNKRQAQRLMANKSLRDIEREFSKSSKKDA